MKVQNKKIVQFKKLEYAFKKKFHVNCNKNYGFDLILQLSLNKFSIIEYRNPVN